jgi:hypothetical protein
MPANLKTYVKKPLSNIKGALRGALLKKGVHRRALQTDAQSRRSVKNVGALLRYLLCPALKIPRRHPVSNLWAFPESDCRLVLDKRGHCC